jgi:hypothetical protein
MAGFLYTKTDEAKFASSVLFLGNI